MSGEDLGPAAPMSDDDAALRAPFARWLAARWPEAEALELGDFESPKSGFSARTLFAPLRYRRDGRDVEDKVVLRLESPDPAIYPQQAPGLDVEVEIQFRVMECLHPTGAAPLAGLIGYEGDASILGAPFFAMEYRGGDVAIENPPYTQEGFFVEAKPEARRRMIESGLRILARLHALDPHRAGLGWLAHPGREPGLATQLDLWEGYARRELDGRELPLFDRGVAWLRERMPTGLASGFSWGDPRLGNIIFRDAEPVCITDFENAALAPAEFDLGWWLLFDRTMHEVVDRPRLPGDLPRDEQRALYCDFAGRDVGDTRFHEVFAGVRYSAIVVRVMNRAVARGFLPADQEIWRNNPALTALEQVLEG